MDGRAAIPNCPSYEPTRRTAGAANPSLHLYPAPSPLTLSLPSSAEAVSGMGKEIGLWIVQGWRGHTSLHPIVSGETGLFLGADGHAATLARVNPCCTRCTARKSRRPMQPVQAVTHY